MNLMSLTRSSLVAAALLIAITGCSGEAETTAAENQNNKLVKTITLSSVDRGGYREFPAVVEASEEATGPNVRKQPWLFGCRVSSIH